MYSGTSKAALGYIYIQRNLNLLLQLIVHIKITVLGVHTPLQATHDLLYLGTQSGLYFCKMGEKKSSNALI